MPDYDFHQLSPYNLEVLARDLLQAHWGVTLESFKAGKDGGIDLRYASAAGKLVVQVKHMLRTGLAGLLRELKKEAAKVRQLQPDRYVLVTSVPLSAANKDAVVGIIGADVIRPSDVIGQEDLNNLLGQHGEIERGHYKLWLASRAVLDRVLHNAALTRSEFKARQVYEDARRYVQGGVYPEAMRMLDSRHVVVIAGPPGVGKSTLANLLLYEHLERGFCPVLIQRDIDEGQALFQPGVRQVFHFDDFMGATFLGDRTATAAGMGDRALLDFIAMIRATPTARLVLTTREHVYAQALDRSERLRLSELDDLRVFLRMPSYSLMQRGRILYNHLYFSDLPVAYQDELLRDDFYLRIVRHEKFNPRLIEWLSSHRRIRSVPVRQYRAFVEDLLRDPSDIWRHAYEQEITDAGRSMLLTVFSLGGKAGEGVLRRAFVSLHRERAGRYRFKSRPEDYASALREVAGTFIKPSGVGGVEVIDPSVLDLLNAVVRSTPENAVDVVSGAASFDQVERVWTFANAAGGEPVLDQLRHHAGQLADVVQALAAEGRRVAFYGGVAFLGATFERCLAVIVAMADQLQSHAFEALVTPSFSRLQLEWSTERPDINDAIAALRALNRSTSVARIEVTQIGRAIREAVLAEASSGCRSDELREVIDFIDVSAGAGDPAVVAARSAFEAYRCTTFSDELRECRSRDQYDAMLEDLHVFSEQLGVDVSALADRVGEAKSEFEEHEEERADQMQDEWKERWRDERQNEQSLSEMFESLRSNRD